MEAKKVIVKVSLEIGWNQRQELKVLYHNVTPRLSTLLSCGYKNLSREQKTEWNSRCVSTIHAVVVGGLALYILWFDDLVNKDHIWGDPKLVKLNIAIASGYLINDLMLLIWHWKTLGDSFFLSHHLAALYAYQYVLGQGLLPYFANFRLIAELSTPFVNQRWFFEVLQFPRNARLVVLNGVAMTVSFFLVRIAVIPSYYLQMASTFGTAGFHRLGLGPQCAWIISSVVLDILNTIWMYKIARGCWKILFASQNYRKTKLS
ncbi:TLC domain-containing protein 4-B-like isoform X1 [Rhincodon typus]|uniref:TLC domain-containing protein 4-B-like isoform X1 n=1 Tax=Rhincodon typus TaxID=259920 RepID=UPI00202EF95F|nr:TLC domain-containing protein 4-B-like isoform X1 [Rhincodon typus]